VSTATITSKGQLTIPKPVREAMNLNEGDQVVVVIEDERIALYPVRRRGILSLQGTFAGLRPYPGREAEHEAAMQEAAREALGLPEEWVMPAYLIDANVIPRFLTNEPLDMAKRAAALFHEIAAGTITVTVEDISLPKSS